MTSDTVAVHGTARYVAARFGRGSLVTVQDKLDNFMSSLIVMFFLEKPKFPTSAIAHSQFLHQSQLRS